MAAYQIGGLALALGIGSAVVAGGGVAAADTLDGSTGSPSTESSVSTESSPAASVEVEKPAGTTESKKTGDADAERPRNKGSKASRASESADHPDVRSTSKASTAQATRTKPTTVRTVDRPPATADVSALSEPAEPPQPKVSKQDPAEVATVALSKAVSALFDSFTGDAPTAPVQSPAVWTLAAATRRELSAASTSLDRPADPVTNSLTAATTPAAVEAPKVFAIEQTAPLEFLQRLPVVGPIFFTPIVVVLHQIPVVSDVLHQFVGFPVQMGLPANAPRPRDVKVVSFDGTQIYVHFMPASGLQPGVKAPTVLDGPGLGLPGSTNINGTLLDPVLTDTTGLMGVGTLRDAGYNVVTWDPRGEWKSGGRLDLNNPDVEARDMSAIIDWISTQPEVRLDAPGDPRIGMVGVSYGGGIQLVTAADDHRVDAIVPAITYHGLDTALYKNGAFKSSWATPLTAVLGLTLTSFNPRILPATVYGDLTGTMTQSDLDLLIARNPDVSKIIAPTLLVQGTADTLFSLQEADDTARILLADGVPTKVVWFCGGHGVCANNLLDLRDGALIEQRTLEWLDRYVMGNPSVSTGPQFEWVDQRGQWFSSNTYPVTQGPAIVTSTSGAHTLSLIPYLGGSGLPFVPFALRAPHAVNLTIPAATATTYLVGAPKLTMTYSGTGSSSHVYAQLVDDKTGLVLGSLATPIPVTLDGQSHTITVPLEPVAHTLRPGESVTLQLVATAGLYERIIPSLGVLDVSSMQMTLPTADPAAISSTSAFAATTTAA
jgi:ABC-2 type transport system ATP-binding protein